MTKTVPPGDAPTSATASTPSDQAAEPQASTPDSAESPPSDADEIIGSAFATSTNPATLPQKEFAPWHLPRKHHIRVQQWCACLRDLVVALKGYGELAHRPVKYLSLPGDELIDIRTIHGVCDKEDVQLQFLGFNNAAPSSPSRSELQLSESEVKRLGRIVGASSLILHDRIEEISVPRSMAARHAGEQGSFDVINLDFCNSIADGASASHQGGLQLLRTLIENQRLRRTRPWLLYLTSRADAAAVDSGVARTLADRLLANLHADTEFAQQLQQKLNTSEESLKGVPPLGADLPRHALNFSLALGKWMAVIALRSTPVWSVTLLDAAMYRVFGDRPDMVSLVFKFEMNQTVVADPDGLSVAPAGAQSVVDTDEVSLAKKMLAAAAKALDVDDHLKANRTAWERARRQSREILEAARYDPAQYDTWVDEEETRRSLR